VAGSPKETPHLGFFSATEYRVEADKDIIQTSYLRGTTLIQNEVGPWQFPGKALKKPWQRLSQLNDV
jgi:hypothetical protein